MSQSNSDLFRFPACPGDVWSGICRRAALQMLATAIEADVGEWIACRTEVQGLLAHRQGEFQRGQASLMGPRVQARSSIKEA